MYKWMIFNAVLFFLCVPGVVVTLPPRGSCLHVALTHALVFAIAHAVLYQYVNTLEFFEVGPNTNVPAVCPPGAKHDSKGECRLP